MYLDAIAFRSRGANSYTLTDITNRNGVDENCKVHPGKINDIKFEFIIDFASFEGLDVSKSKDRMISLVSLNTTVGSFDKKSETDRESQKNSVESLFDELYHVDKNNPDKSKKGGDSDHEAEGMRFEFDDKGNVIISAVKGSDLDKLRQQYEEVKNKEEKKAKN